MIELELLGTSADGESLVLSDAQGERYTVLITDELRGAIRRDRPRIDTSLSRPGLAPRDIQALLRAGATPQDIASQHGMDVSAVERFEAPIQAEKDYALSRARAVRITDGGPTMEELVADRLSARGVAPESLEWSAMREAGVPWQISLTFVQGASEHAAHWNLLSSGTLEAVDQEAQWLTERGGPGPAPTAASVLPPLSSPAPTRDEDLLAREILVDQLNAVRGKRQHVDIDLGEEDEEAEYLAAISQESSAEESAPLASAAAPSPASARLYALPGTVEDSQEEPPTPSMPLPALTPTLAADTHANGTQVDNAAAIASGDAHAPDTTPDGGRRSGAGLAKNASKKGRRSVPSWDEILFGSKS